MYRKASFWGIVLVLTAGCATFHPKSLSPRETFSSFESRTLENLNLARFMEKNLHREMKPWPPHSWEFNVLSLAAFYYHPDLDVARARWGIAAASITIAGARPNPSLGTTPEISSNAPSGVSPWMLRFGLDIPIETAGKRGYRIVEAKSKCLFPGSE